MCQNLCTYGLPGGRSIGASDYPATSRQPCPGPGAKAAERKCLEMAIYVTSAESPCKGCLLVADPESCNDKGCPLWQRWFASSWNGLRKNVQSQYHQARLETVGVIIGGRRYAPPHRREAFLATDPCLSCACPKSLCREDCRLRQHWVAGKKEVLQ